METLARQQPPLPFMDPFEPRILPHNGGSFWTLNVKQQNGVITQRPYRLSQLEWVVRNVRTDIDTFMSQALFSEPNRRALNVSWLTHAYVDLDLYKIPGLCDYSIDQIVGQICGFCRDDGTPLPSFIVFSGRGLYLKWSWAQPIPKAAVGRAVAVNRALVRRFARWGADPSAVDVSRILRVVGTTNSRSGAAARIVWTNDSGGNIVSYDFELFADEVLPFTLDEHRERRGKLLILNQERDRRAAAQGRRPGFCWDDWHWKVMLDIEKLAELRFPGGIVGPGWRDTFGFLGACQLAHVVSGRNLWLECCSWARKILPPGYIETDYRRHASTLLSRVQDAQRGERVMWEGRSRSTIYTFRKATMIDQLGVTPAEMPLMKALIDDAEKRRRDAEATRAARRAAGARERAEYEGRSRARRVQVRELRDQGMTWRAIAASVGISEGEARRLAATPHA